MGIASIGAAASSSTSSQRSGEPSSLVVGGAVGGIAAIASFAPSMLTRSHLDQGIVTAGSALIGFGIGAAANLGIDQLDRNDGLTPTENRLAVAGASAAALIALRGHGDGSQIARSAALTLGASALVGAGVTQTGKLAHAVAPNSGAGQTAVDVGVAGTVAAVAGLALYKHAYDAAAPLRAAQQAAKQAAGDLPAFDLARYQQIDTERAPIFAAASNEFDLLPLKAGDAQQSRFLAQTTPATEIQRVMGDAQPVRDPKRIYVPEMPGKSPQEIGQLVKSAVQRAQTTGQPYSNWRVYVSSGTGFVDPMGPEADEYGARGDVLSIGIQYGHRPSVLSTDEVPREKQIHLATVDALNGLRDELPEAQRPASITEQGESLGAWGIQDSYVGEGSTGPAEHGIARQLLVGTPAQAKWKQGVLAGHATSADGKVVEVASPAGFRALPQAQRDAATTVMLTHRDDPVGYFDFKTFLRPARGAVDGRPNGMPPGYHFIPGVSGMQLAIDTKNGARVIPGLLGKTGHDYRADMADIENAVFHPDTTSGQVDSISSALAQSELAREHAPQLTLLPQTRASAVQ